MLMNNHEYLNVLEDIKSQIKSAKYRAILNANNELICLYWNIGKLINDNSSWGNKFIENLARDIKSEFTNVTGYSVRNLKYMAKFNTEYPDFEFVQQVVAQIPWGHNIVLLDKFNDNKIREWYILQCIKNSWSRSVLAYQIDLNLYGRQVLSEKVHNFDKMLANPQSELAIQTMKDPYVFDFIEAKEDLLEKEIENELVKNITKFLLELGTGFAFVGQQYHLEVGDEDFYIDLLFYNLNLRCYFVIELKTGKFIPEYAGKLNFYLSAVDDILKKDVDNPSIGILLCRQKNNIIAEYALKDISKPIGISEYKLTEVIPQNFVDSLPSIEDITSRLIDMRSTK